MLLTRLIQIQTNASAGSKDTQQKPQGTLRPIETPLGPVDIFSVAQSQGIFKVEPIEFIRLEQIKSWLCEGRALNRNCGTTGHKGRWLLL